MTNQPMSPAEFRKGLMGVASVLKLEPELEKIYFEVLNKYADHYRLLDEQKWDNYELKERYEWFIAKNGLIDEYIKYMDEHEDLYLNGEPEDDDEDRGEL